MEENSRYSPVTIRRQSIQSPRNVNLNSSHHFKVWLKVDQDRRIQGVFGLFILHAILPSASDCILLPHEVSFEVAHVKI